MDLRLTFALLLAGISVTALSAWRSGQPRRDSIRVRWTPWRFLILIGGVIILYALVHLLNLAGIETGAGRSFR